MSELSETDPRLRSAASAAEVLGKIQGTDIQRHPDSSMLKAVVKEQIRYSFAKEALVDTFSARIPLTVVDGTDQGGCCSVEGGCCGGAAQVESSED